MRHLLKYFTLAICLIFPIISWSDVTSQQQLVKLLGDTKSLQADFMQSVLGARGNVLQQTKGKMSLQRPGKFRWETLSPSKQLLVADGTHIWFYDVDLAQVSTQKQQSSNSGSPAMLLSGKVESLARDFEITSIASSDDKQQAFKLVPKTKNNLFQAVELYFRGNNLQNMRLLDNLQQATVIKFSKVKTNPSLSAALFQFVPPKGVDVVTQ